MRVLVTLVVSVLGPVGPPEDHQSMVDEIGSAVELALRQAGGPAFVLESISAEKLGEAKDG